MSQELWRLVRSRLLLQAQRGAVRQERRWWSLPECSRRVRHLNMTQKLMGHVCARAILKKPLAEVEQLVLEDEDRQLLFEALAAQHEEDLASKHWFAQHRTSGQDGLEKQHFASVTAGRTKVPVEGVVHDGGWYDDEAELHFRFSWRHLRPFNAQRANNNLEKEEHFRRRRKRALLDEIAANQRLDRTRGVLVAALRSQVRELGAQPCA